MKKAGIILNFVHDTAKVLGDMTDLVCTSSGYYCILLTNLLFDRQGELSVCGVTPHFCKNLNSRREKKKGNEAMQTIFKVV